MGWDAARVSGPSSPDTLSEWGPLEASRAPGGSQHKSVNTHGTPTCTAGCLALTLCVPG